MELHHVEVVGLHADKALFDARHDVVAGDEVGAPLTARARRRADQTAAFAGQIVGRAPIRDIAAGPLLTESVIDRGVNVVDPGIEHGIKNGFRLRLGDVAGARGAPQFHRPIAQRRDLQAGPPEFTLW